MDLINIVSPYFNPESNPPMNDRLSRLAFDVIPCFRAKIVRLSNNFDTQAKNFYFVDGTCRSMSYRYFVCIAVPQGAKHIDKVGRTQQIVHMSASISVFP